MTRHGVGRRHVIALSVLAVGCTMAACGTGGGVDAPQQRGLGAARSTTTSSTSGARASPTTSSSTPTPPDGTSSPGRSDVSQPASVTTVPASTPTTSASSAPDVVGESLSTGEAQLQTAGYDISAHPWGGSCATANAIMQQVPPQNDNVQIFYCAAPS